MTVNRISTVLEVDASKAAAGFREAEKAAGQYAGGLDKATKRQAAFDDVAGKAALAGVAVAGGLALAVKRFADFDAAMSGVAANTGAAGAEMDKLREIAVELGSDTIFSAKEAADGMNELAKAGVSTADIMGGGLKGSLDLAAAGQIGVADAAEIAASAMTQFNLDGSQVSHVADLMANAANKAQGGVGDMGQALQQAGLVASATGLSIEETTAGLTAFAAAGLTGSDAGTSFKTMLQRLSAPTGEAADLMEELGISAYDSQGNFVGLAEVAGQLESSMSSLAPEQRNAAMATIFGSDAVRAANVLYTEGADGIAKWTSEVSEQGAAAEQAAKLTDNLKGDIERLGGAFDEVFISTGGSANGALRTLVQGAEGLVEVIGGIPGPVLLAGGALSSLALVGPKAVSGFREYRTNLDTLGLSMGKIEKRAPRTAKAIRGVGLAAGGLAAYGTALAIFGDDLNSIGSEQLIRDLRETSDAIGTINAAIAKADDGTSDVQDLGKALEVSFDPNWIDQTGAALDGLFSIFGAEKTGEIAVAEKRLGELDETMARMVSGGNAEGARQMMAAIEAEAKAQGISVEDLRKEFPLLAEAYAAAENSGDGMKTAMEEQEQAAADAEAAIDELRTSVEMLGGGLRGERAAQRDYNDAVKAAAEIATMSADEQEAALDRIADGALGVASAQIEMGRSSDVVAADLAVARKAYIDAGVAAGKSRPYMNQLADAMGLIPEDVETMISQSGAGQAQAEVLDLDTQIKLLNGKTVSVEEAGAIPAKGRVLELDGSIFGLDGKTVKVTEIGATASGDRVVLLDGKIYRLDGKTVDVTADVHGINYVQALDRTITNLHGKKITITTEMLTVYRTQGVRVAGVTGRGGMTQADGGIGERGAGGGLHRFMADGGTIGSFQGQMPHIRAAGGAGVTWAEEGAGPWEAWISGHPAKTARSKAIADDVVARLGGAVMWPTRMADGGTRDYQQHYRSYASASPAPVMVQQPQAQPSMSGMEITGTLDTPWGPAQVRGIVKDELTSQARQARIQGAR